MRGSTGKLNPYIGFWTLPFLMTLVVFFPRSNIRIDSFWNEARTHAPYRIHEFSFLIEISGIKPPTLLTWLWILC